MSKIKQNTIQELQREQGTVCCYCYKNITERYFKTVYAKAGKKKNKRLFKEYYHWNCWKRKGMCYYNSKKNIKNPMRG